MSLLDDVQLQAIAHVSARLERFKEATADLNQEISNLSAFIGQPIRLIPTYPPVLPANDLSQVLFSHELAKRQMQADAMERMVA